MPRGTASSLSALPFPVLPEFMHPFEAHDILSSLPSLEIANNAATAAEALVEEGSALEALGQDIFTFLVASVAVVPLSRKLNISPVLGFLAVGCAIGPFGVELFSNTEADLELGDIGILFLLFNEGLSLSPERIKDLSAFLGLGAVQLIASIGLFFGGTVLLGPQALEVIQGLGVPLDAEILRPIYSSPPEIFCISAAAALSSSAFVLPVLKQKDWEDQKEGIAGLSILLLQDLAVAPLLVILPLLAGSGPQTSSDLTLLLAKATIGFGIVLAAGSYILRYVFEFVAAARSTETFVAAAILVVISMGQVADGLGLSASTGAFAAGVLLAGNRFRPQIQADIKPFEGILLGVFFMTAGANLDPSLVVQEWPTLLTGILSCVVTKASVVFATGPALGLTLGESARVALTLAGGGEFAFVLFKLAEELNVLPNDLVKFLTALTIISMSLTPMLGEVGDSVGTYLDERFGEVDDSERGPGLTDEEASALFDEIDDDESGSIELDELREALLKRGFQYASIAEIFSSFDADGDGSIDREEWKDGLDAGLLASALDLTQKGVRESGIEFDENAMVICGYGEMAKAVWKMLERSGSVPAGSVVAFERNPTLVTAGVLTGAPVVCGDGARNDLLKAVGVKRPRAVIVTYASDARRIDATMRLRESLPPDTPIYVRAGASNRINKELLDAGATDVIVERTEAVLRFGSLIGVVSPTEMGKIRELSIGSSGSTTDDDEEAEVVPGFSDEALTDLQEEVGCTRRDLIKLHEQFLSLKQRGKDDVAIAELSGMVMRSTDDAPLDYEKLDRRMRRVGDKDGRGKVTFDEFVRVSFGSSSE